MSKHFCQACSFAAYGVKTRIAIPHTCGNPSPPPTVVKHRETTREEIDLYIARLRELWDDENQEWKQKTS